MDDYLKMKLKFLFAYWAPVAAIMILSVFLNSVVILFGGLSAYIVVWVWIMRCEERGYEVGK